LPLNNPVPARRDSVRRYVHAIVGNGVPRDVFRRLPFYAVPVDNPPYSLAQ